MDPQDRELLAGLATRASARTKTSASELLDRWAARLAGRPAYLVRWLATAASTDPEAVEQLLAELGWLETASRPKPVVDPDRARQAAALYRFRSATELFDRAGLSPEDERHFAARFTTLGEGVESLLWKRTSEATYLALLELLGLSRRPAPASERPSGP